MLLSEASLKKMQQGRMRIHKPSKVVKNFKNSLEAIGLEIVPKRKYSYQKIKNQIDWQKVKAAAIRR